VERQAPLLVPLGPGDLGPVQAAGAADLDALGAEPERRLDPLLHGAAERDPALELHGDGLGHQLGVRFRPLDLDDVDVDLDPGPLLELVAQLVDLGSPLADDDSRAGSLNVDLQLVRETRDVDLGHAGVRQPPLELFAEREVLVKVPLVVLDGEPARMPRAVETEAEAVRVNFLTHG